MDRRVKERLIGASILGVLVVLIVPELLSGPAPPTSPTAPSNAAEPTRSVTVDLATSKATPAEPALPPVADNAAAAGNAAASATSPQPRGMPSVVTLPASSGPAPAPPSVERPSSPPTSNSQGSKAAGHSWAVQLGVFASRSNADRLAREMKAQGFPAYVLSGGAGTSVRYRVRIGPMGDRGTAAQTLAKLQSLGHPGSLAPPGT